MESITFGVGFCEAETSMFADVCMLVCVLVVHNYIIGLQYVSLPKVRAE